MGSDLLIVGIPLTVLIGVLVEFAKQQGLQAKYAPAAALGIGLVLGLASQLVSVIPEIGPWYDAAMLGIIAALSAAGLYSGGKALGRRS